MSPTTPTQNMKHHGDRVRVPANENPIGCVTSIGGTSLSAVATLVGFFAMTWGGIIWHRKPIAIVVAMTAWLMANRVRHPHLEMAAA